MQEMSSMIKGKNEEIAQLKKALASHRPLGMTMILYVAVNL